MRTDTANGQPRVDVSKVTGRRKLRFESLREVLAEAQALAESEVVGTSGRPAAPVRHLGNMSFAQALGHLAEWMNASIDGNIPMDPPWLVKLFGRLFKPFILAGGLPPGYKLPPAAERRFVPAPDISVEKGLAQLEAAIARLEEEPGRVPSPLLGRMSIEDWERLHLRHAELHLSFMQPGSDGLKV